MSSIAVCMGLWLLLASDGGSFEFTDASTFAGRPLLQFRPIELRETPAKPLDGDFTPSAGARYGLLPVGPSAQTALSVVWLPKAPSGPELWLDADGDGHLAKSERHPFPGRELQLPATITIQLPPDEKRVDRTIVVRRSSIGDGLRYAVHGFAQGRLQLAGRSYRALLIDGNADGRFNSVGQDRLWIDLNDDGRFDPILEQFPLGKPIQLGSQVYVVRSDPLATAVQVSLRGSETGKLSLAMPGKRPTKISAELLSDLGELVVIDKLEKAVDVPTGKYHVSSLELELTDAAGQTWSYSFSEDKAREHTVQTGKQASVELLDALEMKVSFELYGRKVRPGDSVPITPQLRSGDGLVLSSCKVGKDRDFRQPEASAEILLRSLDGRTISRGVSGFS